MKYKFFTLVFLLSIVCNCGGSKATIKPSPEADEARARQSFAREINQSYPFRVSFSAQGEEKDVLEITIIEEVSPSASAGVVEIIVTDELKADAKRLKFKQIAIKGGRKSFTAPDTVDKKIDLN